MPPADQPALPLDSADEAATYAQVTRRLLPILFVCYVIAYLDRVNVGFAKLSMSHDLGFSEATYGLGAGIFFVGYCLCELPSNLILARVGARRWIARIMVTWGILSASMLFVRTPGSFYLLRLLLGIAEAGMFPGVIFYLTLWYPARRRGGIVALFMTAQPISGLLGGPLSGWILQSLNGAKHLAGWQWLFLIEALPAILMGIVVLFTIDDSIADAAWLHADQRHLLARNLAVDTARKHAFSSIPGVLGDRRLWLLSLISFSSVLGLYGVSFWLPSLIRATGVERPLDIGLLMTIPYGAAVISMVLAGRSSDRRGERRWHLALATIVGGVGLLISTLAGAHPAISLVALSVATAGIFSSQPLFWNLPTAFLGGTAAAAAIGLINALANTAGFVSPYLVGWINTRTRSTEVGMYVLAASLFLGSALTFLVPAALVDPKHNPDLPGRTEAKA